MALILMAMMVTMSEYHCCEDEERGQSVCCYIRFGDGCGGNVILAVHLSTFGKRDRSAQDITRQEIR